MPRSLLLAVIAMVAAPLVLLGWLSATTVRERQRTSQQRIVALLETRLSEIDRSLTEIFDDYARHIRSRVEGPGRLVDRLVDMQREDPIVRRSLLVSQSGVVVFPGPPTTGNPDDYTLYAALTALAESRPRRGFGGTASTSNTVRQNQVSQGSISSFVSPSRSTSRRPAPERRPPVQIQAGKDTSMPPAKRKKSSPLPEPSWDLWYMDEGTQLAYWIPQSDGSMAGILLERARWMSDLTASLPDSLPSHNRLPGQSAAAADSVAVGFSTLTNESQEIVYRWGDDGTQTESALASIDLSGPLKSWRLEYYATAELLPPSDLLATYLTLAGSGILLLALGVYVMTSVQRQIREARGRVSFAGQVSHELRTPLTNIRLYAELAEADVGELAATDTKASLQHRLSVINAESQRLSRLVSGVLEMIRRDGPARGPRLSNAVPDRVIDRVVEQFAPSFQNAAIMVHRGADAGRSVQIDRDILEMVLTNLLSNVSKYAVPPANSGPGRVRIESRLADGQLVVTVADDGPGIPARYRRSIFKPFTRINHSISAPSGTGIGLAIARSAAARHDGHLKLVDSDRGATFELRLPVTPAAPESESNEL